jgi:DNA-binding LytR/AlgR family response regulator
MKELLEEIIKPRVIRNGNHLQSGKSQLLIKDAVFVRQEGNLLKIKHQDILWIKADGNYTHLFTRKGKFSVRHILKDFESIMPQEFFMRIHKSYIVQLALIEEISLKELRIEDEWIPLGRTFHQRLISGIQKLGNIGD